MRGSQRRDTRRRVGLDVAPLAEAAASRDGASLSSPGHVRPTPEGVPHHRLSASAHSAGISAFSRDVTLPSDRTSPCEVIGRLDQDSIGMFGSAVVFTLDNVQTRQGESLGESPGHP